MEQNIYQELPDAAWEQSPENAPIPPIRCSEYWFSRCEEEYGRFSLMLENDRDNRLQAINSRILSVSGASHVMSLYQEGFNIAEITRITGYYDKAVRNSIKVSDRKAKKVERVDLRYKCVEPEVLRMINKGIGLKRIGEVVGISWKVVRRIRDRQPDLSGRPIKNYLAELRISPQQLRNLNDHRSLVDISLLLAEQGILIAARMLSDILKQADLSRGMGKRGPGLRYDDFGEIIEIVELDDDRFMSGVSLSTVRNMLAQMLEERP